MKKLLQRFGISEEYLSSPLFTSILNEAFQNGFSTEFIYSRCGWFANGCYQTNIQVLKEYSWFDEISQKVICVLLLNTSFLNGFYITEYLPISNHLSIK